MVFWKNVVKYTGWGVGKILHGGAVAVGYTASAIPQIAGRGDIGRTIREGSHSVGETIDGASETIGEYAGTAADKTLDFIEETTQTAVEFSRPGARWVLAELNEKVSDESFQRPFEGFDPPLETWSHDELSGLIELWQVRETALDRGEPIRSVKGALEHFSCNAAGLLFTKSAISYPEILRGALSALDLKSRSRAVEEMENVVIEHLWKKTIAHLDKEELAKLQREIQKSTTSENASAKIGADISTALFAAQMSGFGIYLAATTIAGTLTSLIGTTLPFAFYTSMTSTISLAIGPLGFLGAGLVVLVGASGKNWDKLLPFILYCRALRENKLQRYSASLV